ncbi:hypothetical protein RF11_02239 [Thelohanellus kitauei]|uniref:Uncharacterized protein n=1 Tax=Thelohanellus kitauei TaxID=669202 RepID=A0A0C2M8W1_THEKT|nr:hypothetical protein RF11_02239 [Thelohanellus kitauei]
MTGQDTMCGRVNGRAAVMTDLKQGLVARIKIFTRHIALAENGMNKGLAEAFTVCIIIVNFIKAGPFNHLLFENMCLEMEATHKNLLLYTEVRWLSPGLFM